MGRVIWTTIFWALIVIIAGFYMKFMNQDLGEKVSNWIMTIEASDDMGEEGEIVDPIQQILSGVNDLQLKVTEGFSGLYMKLDTTQEVEAPKLPTPKVEEVVEVSEGTEGEATGAGTGS
ncbi:hypothetical protein K9M48_01475 [Candidatus Gracilibacteria bacterium]|nr:hypothetical protein [Candidatus Gracilibacteria bacterium]